MYGIAKEYEKDQDEKFLNAAKKILKINSVADFIKKKEKILIEEVIELIKGDDFLKVKELSEIIEAIRIVTKGKI